MTSESRPFLYIAWRAVFNAELENAESNCSSDSFSALNLSYSFSLFDWSGGSIDTPEANKTEELGEDTVEPYLYEAGVYWLAPGLAVLVALFRVRVLKTTATGLASVRGKRLPRSLEYGRSSAVLQPFSFC